MRRLTGIERYLIRAIGSLAGDRGEMLKMYDALGYVPNLLRPRSFNEKVGRAKLLRAPPLWSELADKVRVRKHVAERVGANFLSELCLVTTDPTQLRFADLPSRFVVKANHASGWNHVVIDRSAVSEETLRASCTRWMSRRYGGDTNESWYASIPPQLLVEEYLDDANHVIPLDYKFWVFHGVVRFIQVDSARFSHHTRTIYDRNWKRQSWGHNPAYPPGPKLERPALLGRMLEVAESLTFDAEFIRVDLYCVSDVRIVFGELTFAPGAGRVRFWPDAAVDFRVGSFW